MKQPIIRCPQCEWRPKSESRWQCIPSCGAEWNTFWTAGVCPGCAYRWEKTQCLACGEISPHKNWYHTPDEEDESQQTGRDEPVTA